MARQTRLVGALCYLLPDYNDGNMVASFIANIGEGASAGDRLDHKNDPRSAEGYGNAKPTSEAQTPH